MISANLEVIWAMSAKRVAVIRRLLVGPLCAAAFAVLSSDALAFQSGYDLMKASTRGHEFRAYVSGIMEGHMLTAALLQVPQFTCPDPEITRQELAGVVLLWLSKNPQRLGMTARSLVLTALIEQYPCR